MDPVKNPFVPGAGSRPPELAGRDHILNDATIAIQRALAGRHARSQILLGLRGVGKTVLLNQIEQIAEQNGHLTSMIEAPEDRGLPELLYPRLAQTLRRLSLIEQSKATAHAALQALRSFAGVFRIAFGDISIVVDPQPGIADSGNLEFDLTDLFLKVGEAAQSAGKGWTLLIDEIQYLKEADYAALIVALHRVSQRNLPVLFFGAGLPQVAALSGEAKSYAERLFSYPAVGALDRDAARLAITVPVEDENEQIEAEAVEAIIDHAQGYPYFLQEWGYQAWNAADQSPIDVEDVVRSSERAVARLDDGFFRVRFDRLTPAERDYVCAMARLGDGPYRSGDVAEALQRPPQRLGPMRASIIRKGMIYSPSHGDIAFTVPLFADYLRRHWIGA